jgi:hypothetical protein
MNILVIILIVFVVVAGGILSYKNYYVVWQSSSRLRRKFLTLEPLLAKLNSKQVIGAAEVMAIALIPSLRHALFRMLEEYPTELGKAPDEIFLVANVLHNADAGLEYFVFKFFSQQPPWAARTGWMIGVSGPYAVQSRHYDAPLRVFSRFNKLGSVTAEQEVKWVHENINPGNEDGRAREELLLRGFWSPVETSQSHGSYFHRSAGPRNPLRQAVLPGYSEETFQYGSVEDPLPQ